MQVFPHFVVVKLHIHNPKKHGLRNFLIINYNTLFSHFSRFFCFVCSESRDRSILYNFIYQNILSWATKFFLNLLQSICKKIGPVPFSRILYAHPPPPIFELVPTALSYIFLNKVHFYNYQFLDPKAKSRLLSFPFPGHVELRINSGQCGSRKPYMWDWKTYH